MSRTLADVAELERFSEEYFKWISDWMDPEHEYTILLRHLFEFEYIWIVDRDANRAEDGCFLRNKFEEASGIECKETYIDWPSSVLEMLVALAVRIDDQMMYDISIGERADKWFWEMIKNLGLADFYDEKWRRNPNAYAERTASILNGFMLKRDGYSLFTTDGSKEWDGLELWVQANRYFSLKKMG